MYNGDTEEGTKSIRLTAFEKHSEWELPDDVDHQSVILFLKLINSKLLNVCAH